MTIKEAMFDRREMLIVHDVFRREFGLMPGFVRDVEEGDEKRAAIVSDHIQFLTMVLHHHHHGEDAYTWPVLLERCTAEVVPFVRLMESQHEQVAKLGDEVDQALGAWRGNPTKQTRASATMAPTGALLAIPRL